MNLQQAKITLEKINRLYQSMTLDSTIDEHEQQLMLSYIRHFYKAFSGEILETPTPKSTKPAFEPTKLTPPVQKSAPIIQRTKPTPPPKPAPTPEPEPIEEVIEDITEEIVVPTPQPKPQPVAPTPRVTTPPAPKKDPEFAKVTTSTSNEFSELFEEQEAKELSDRLSSRPIKDLTKAIGINEKILTCNELFAKDNERFNTALRKLNTYGSFQEARPYLVMLAKEYNWDDEKRKKKAQVFIKLVRRRYN